MRTSGRVEKSAMPAKGDRGRSESDIARSYSECRRTTPRSLRGRRHANSRLLGPSCRRPAAPTGLERPATSSAGRPRRGGSAGHLEMAHSLISTGLLGVISSRHAGDAKRLGKPPFPDVHTYFHGHEAGLSCWTSRMAEQRLGGCTAEPEAEVAPAL